MTDALVFILATLTSYRLWRLLAADSLPLIKEPRDRIEAAITRRHGSDWSGGIACPWCLGFWCAAAVIGAVWAIRPLPLPALWFAATSCAVGLIANYDLEA